MIKGLYAAASAMLAGVTRQKNLAHNAANMDTPGFKQTLSSLAEFMKTSVIYPPGNITNAPQQTYLGDIGLGVMNSPLTTDYSEGPLNQTSNPYDLSITGPGFFRIRTPDGERITRDGRFLRDSSGQLETLDGNLILNKAGQPIKLPEGDFSVGEDGTIAVNGATIGQIGLVAFKNPQTELVMDKNNLFQATGNPTSQVVGRVEQGYLESSNVNSAQLMTQMISTARSYEAAQKMVQTQDDLLGQTISSLGRVA
jgi:flagellar basal-body rod protein FlgF